ncbi:hypothetical protein [Brevibacillus sp. VP]|uniref:hypothetical protein n=1 Tax=unclassified Brevibacillus TaxID=2684853 RepID=UPI000E2F7197|nr:hypothetical protein [Brevibacillus sp. VP]RFB34971.1 hypothetical protein DZB91_10605 [Brevibacillus sp. VP]
MFKWSKLLLSCLAVVLCVGLFSQTTFTQETTTPDDFDLKLDKALAADSEEQEDEKSSPDKVQANVRGLIKLIDLVFKRNNTAKKVVATKEKIPTKLSGHAMDEAFIDGITSKMIDKILSGKSSGAFKLQTYRDISGARVIVDPNSKIVIIMDSKKNKIITVYKDSGKSIKNRPADGRWSPINWFFE